MDLNTDLINLSFSNNEKLQRVSIPIDFRLIEELLEGILKLDIPISMAEAANQIGRDRRVLYRNFPEYCKMISQRYKSYTNEKANNRIKLLKKEVQVIFLLLLEDGIYPSKKEIENRLSKSSVLREIAYKLNCSVYEIMYKENIKTEINVSDYNIQKSNGIPLEVIESQLKENLKLDNPKSLSKIARSTGFGIETARKHFPNLCSSVEENYLAYQEKRKAEDQKEIEHMLSKCLSRDIPISLTKLAEENGIPIKKIRRYFPVLSKKVSLRYNSYLSEIKKRKIEFNLKEIQRVSDDLHRKGIYSSTKKIRQELDDENIFSLYKC